MLKTRLQECIDGAEEHFGYVETDLSGRYGRFREILGKGAMKTVYRAFDEIHGMEVAWNQVELDDVFRSADDLQRLYSEVHLLKTLDHESIIQFYTSWIDVERRTFNFITELLTSGTLREYRQKYKRVDIRAVKNWARQILSGLAYLHGHDPPVIHRDLKCDNIFINGHLGQVKIGDLGLAAILRRSQHARSVIGTPEFMAPELYEEEYNELVDVYSFGMCVLEMLTSEYPYSECSNPAQIYKKVTSGKLPEAFYKIQDEEAQRFVGRCLETVSRRLPAKELLLDPFLASNDGELLPNSPRTPLLKSTLNKMNMEKPAPLSERPTGTTNMLITGTMNNEEGIIFLQVKISEKDGQARNIYFPFDIVNDTAIEVASEMVKELDITNWEPTEIADMIGEQVSSLVPTCEVWDSPKDHQHSFLFEEDDDDGTHHPFYSHSSELSSQVSLPFFDSSLETQSRRGINITASHEWLQEDLIGNDDPVSKSSSYSSKYYSSLNYRSSNKTDSDLSPRKFLPSRFCPEQYKSANCYKDYERKQNLNSQKKMCRTQSFLDVRSQLLHHSLVDELSKRRLFKTVGAVENIGFQEPGHDFP